MMGICGLDTWVTCRPHGSRPDARFALWRPAAHSGIELQTGTSLDEFALPFHFHDSYQFDVMIEGARSYRLRDGVYTVAPGSLCVMHPGEGHAVRLAGQMCSFRTMNVNPERLLEASEQVTGRREAPTFSFEIGDEPTVNLFVAAHRMMESGDRFEADCALTSFLGRLVARHAESRGWRSGAASHKRLRLACDYIEAHLAESILLENLADATGISKFYLVRQFTRGLGLPPHAYQIRLRIARARELLATALAVKRVSAELGFADQSHFGRHFRKTTGLTPAEYQRRVTGQ
jgi:AraC-like DNA-binding protein